MPSIVKLTLESNQYERNIKNAQKSLNDFTRSIGINMKSLSSMALAAGAVTGALKVMKDAFFKSETSLDEWGRTVESSKALYSGFLSALNNTDISGFLNRMDDIVSAARDAYNAIDNLNTYSAFNQRNEAKERSGYAESLDKYKLNPTAENKQALAAANQAVIDGLKETQEQTEAAYISALRNIATQRLGTKELQDAFVKVFSEGGRNALSNAKIGYSTGRGLNAGSQYWYGNKVYDGRIQERSTGQWSDMSAQERQQFEFARALAQVNDTEIREVQALGRQAVALSEQIFQQDRQFNRLAGNNGKVGGSGGSGGGKSGGTTTTPIVYAADSIMAQEKLVSELTEKWKTAGEAVRDDYKVQLDDAKKKLQEMTNPMGPQMKLWQGDIDDMLKGTTPIAGGIPQIGNGLDTLPQVLSPLQEINAEIERWQQLMQYAPTSDYYQVMKQHLEELMLKQKQFTGETTQDVKNSSAAWSTAASAINSVGTAITTIEDPSAKILGLIAQAIATVASAASQAMSAKDVTASGWAWIGAAAAITAQMVAVISQIHSATGYAQGGVVGGKSYSGDNIPILANAGEIVLSKSMQNSLAANLQSNAGSMNLEATVSGEQIRFVLNNYGSRTGRGEYVTTKFQ